MRTEHVYPDASTLVESTRSIGYSFESAVADIIDNSLSKNAKDIIIRFDSNNPRFLAVIDDGIGMDEEELINAMKYGSKSSLEERSSTDLGRFGLGLKMASLSQCRMLTVVTKKNGVLVGAEWNLDMIGDWALIMYEEPEIRKLPCFDILNSFKSGTIVLWRNFDRLGKEENLQGLVFDKNIQLTKKHLSLVFHRYLEPETVSQKISITINGDRIGAIDPFFVRNPATQQLEEELIMVEGGEVRVKPFVLPFSSKLTNPERKLLDDISDLKLGQGFYVYRNKRLIVWGTWFRLLRQEELKRLARVRVDIPNSLDSAWGIDIKKSTAVLPESIKDRLKTIVSKAGGRSEEVYRYRGRKATQDNLDHIWNVIDNRGKISYKINRDSVLVKKIQDSLADSGRSAFNSLILMLEDTFPVRDVYCRFAKSKDQADEPIKNEISFDDCYRAAETYLQLLIDSGIDKETALKSASNLDFIKNHNDVLKMLEENYGTH